MHAYNTHVHMNTHIPVHTCAEEKERGKQGKGEEVEGRRERERDRDRERDSSLVTDIPYPGGGASFLL